MYTISSDRMSDKYLHIIGISDGFPQWRFPQDKQSRGRSEKSSDIRKAQNKQAGKCVESAFRTEAIKALLKRRRKGVFRRTHSRIRVIRERSFRRSFNNAHVFPNFPLSFSAAELPREEILFALIFEVELEEPSEWLWQKRACAIYAPL